MNAIAWLEQTSLSLFVREDFYAYFVLLIFHALGMAFLVGSGIAVSLRVLGVAQGVPLDQFARLFPVMRVAAIVAIISGVGLLLGYPAKALTNWIFALKFACLIAAAVLVWHMARSYFPLPADGELLPAGARWIAAAAIVLWVGGVACGKLLLYTNHMLLTTD